MLLYCHALIAALLLKQHSLFDAAIMLFFYSLYYGILARDFAEVASSNMASATGVCICHCESKALTAILSAPFSTIDIISYTIPYTND